MSPGSDDVDRAYRVLASRQRRRIIRLLSDADGAVTEGALASRLGDRATGNRGRAEERIRIDLHHRHLPMMEDAGVIERVDDGGIVLADHGRALAAIERFGSETFGTRADEESEADEVRDGDALINE